MSSSGTKLKLKGVVSVVEGKLCGSSVTCKEAVVVEAVVLCVLCVLCVSLAVCCAVGVRCCCCCCCCCCGIGVVVGTRGEAGAVVGSSLSPRVVLGVVATVDTAAQTDANLEVEDVVLPAAAVVASAAGSCLDEAVEEGNVEDPEAKAKAGC